MPPLRRRLRQCAEDRRHRRRSSRGFNTVIELRFRYDAGRGRLHQLRSVHRGLPRRRAASKRTTPTRCSDRAGRSRPSTLSCSPLPPCALRWAKNSACPWAPTSTGKMAAALRRLGFDKVFDTDFGADLTIMEEATELLDRMKNGGVLPMITSCSPGWIKFCEHYYPGIPAEPVLLQVSAARCWARSSRPTTPRRPASIPRTSYVVSVMPCTAKKFEVAASRAGCTTAFRMWMSVITTRELARMIKQAGIDFVNLPDERLRRDAGRVHRRRRYLRRDRRRYGSCSAHRLRKSLTGKDLDKHRLHRGSRHRGHQGSDRTTLHGMEVKVAVAHGTGATPRAAGQGEERRSRLHTSSRSWAAPAAASTAAVSRSCPRSDRMNVDPRVLRAKALYNEDRVQDACASPMRTAAVQEALRGVTSAQPNSHKAHELLHTHYVDRSGK